MQVSKGSFGIPPELKEEMERAKKKAEKKESKAAPQESKAAPQEDSVESSPSDWPMEEPTQGASEDTPVQEKMTGYDKAREIIAGKKASMMRSFAEDLAKLDPQDILKALDITYDEKDLQSILLTGTLEKEIKIVKSLTAKIHLLRTSEVEAVDELVANDITTRKFTQLGVENRRNLWTLCFAIEAINGKQLTKTSRTKDPLEYAKEKEAIIQGMSPALLDAITRKHASMQIAYNTILFGEDSDSLKN